MKDIIYRFRSGEKDFMYAVACYGMTMGEVDEISRKLDSLAVDQDARKDPWKMIKSVTSDTNATRRLARFFAAGIVGVNPQEFGLRFRPLSSL
jgi:hypothetical protein